MKKLTLLFLVILAAGGIFQACDNSKTYAEMQEDEKRAISKFIGANNIKVISMGEFLKDTVTNVSENEYVLLSSGVYLQIVNRGGGDTLKTRDEILVRFVEYDIMAEDTTACCNYMNPYPYFELFNLYPAAFTYTKTSTSMSGQFLAGHGLSDTKSYGIYYFWGDLSVPQGWLSVLPHIKDGAHFKMIVPHKMGHTAAQRDVYPYFYDIPEFNVHKYMED